MIKLEKNVNQDDKHFGLFKKGNTDLQSFSVCIGYIFLIFIKTELFLTLRGEVPTINIRVIDRIKILKTDILT